jgi:hypothetical protein
MNVDLIEIPFDLLEPPHASAPVSDNAMLAHRDKRINRKPISWNRTTALDKQNPSCGRCVIMGRRCGYGYKNAAEPG